MRGRETITATGISGAARFASRPLVMGAAAGAGLLFATCAALWGYYGSAVFFEMIAAGLAACF